MMAFIDALGGLGAVEMPFGYLHEMLLRPQTPLLTCGYGNMTVIRDCNGAPWLLRSAYDGAGWYFQAHTFQEDIPRPGYLFLSPNRS
jgi:hypothetical protein